ncbi:MAG: magnetochrome domain-containing protein [Planctomycetes bacterium]|nr:magnetochrome domain-containing protein [Planctomycetota bacterium]
MKQRPDQNTSCATDSDTCGETDCSDSPSCAKSQSKLWLYAGFCVIGMIVIATVSLFSGFDGNDPLKDNMTPMTAQPGAVPLQTPAQPAAFTPPPPACATCPTVPQCFPGTPQQPQAVAFNGQNNMAYPQTPQHFAQGQGQTAYAPNYSYGGVPSPMPQNNSSLPIAFQRTTPQAQKNAANGNALPIGREAPMPHGYRGLCSSCHVIKSVVPIFRDAVMPHTYRGVCSNCHSINPDVAITPKSVMPHNFRGVCINCHEVTAK